MERYLFVRKGLDLRQRRLPIFSNVKWFNSSFYFILSYMMISCVLLLQLGTCFDFDRYQQKGPVWLLVKRIDKGNASFSILWPRFTKFDNCSVLHMSFGGHENHRGRANSVLFSLEHGQSCVKLDKYCPTKESQSPIWTFSFSYVPKDRHALRK